MLGSEYGGNGGQDRQAELLFLELSKRTGDASDGRRLRSLRLVRL